MPTSGPEKPTTQPTTQPHKPPTRPLCLCCHLVVPSLGRPICSKCLRRAGKAVIALPRPPESPADEPYDLTPQGPTPTAPRPRAGRRATTAATKMCERCRTSRALKGERYCFQCRGRVYAQMLRSGYLEPHPPRRPAI